MAILIKYSNYKHKEIHKYIWTSETSKLGAIIDYIILKQETTIKIEEMGGRKGAVCETDPRRTKK